MRIDEAQQKISGALISSATGDTKGKTAGKHKAIAPHLLNNVIPESITNDEELNAAIKARLPAHYNFEIHKTLHMIRQHSIQRVALQLPEGLQMFATSLCELLEEHAYKNIHGSRLCTVILADVTYGACCIDDFTARALGCDLLVHYGHSCLVPITTTTIRTLYVFVDIGFQVQHLIDSLLLNFPPQSTGKIAMVGTIQFSSSLQPLRRIMMEQHGYREVEIPQIRPLSPGEILGCTAPRLAKDVDLCIYLGDGRFHLESIMIANPRLADRFYRYDPYSASLTHEYYAYKDMYAMRRDAIEQARLSSSQTFGVVFGTLGRQGSPAVLQWLQQRLIQRGKRCVVVLLSELTKDKLARFAGSVDIWIQTSCPRLSIDWGYSFARPLLTPYEAMVALLPDSEWLEQKPRWMSISCTNDQPQLQRQCSCNSENEGNTAIAAVEPQNQSVVEEDTEEIVYPMDFYAKYSLGPWTPNYVDKEAEERRRQMRRQQKPLRNHTARMADSHINH